ncbi:MAG: hypothetical protein BWY66_00183 [bacterium ADurb.Bin374]|nr:MAG: hypothetical protein BWY66_00183 [bacterium ADurb.Bin374]
MGNCEQGVVPLDLAGREGQRAVLDEGDHIFLEIAGADLGPLRVEQHGDRCAEPRSHLFQRLDAPSVLRMIAVGEIESRDIHSRVNQLFENLLGFGRGAEGNENLRLAHAIAFRVCDLSRAQLCLRMIATGMPAREERHQA